MRRGGVKPAFLFSMYKIIVLCLSLLTITAQTLKVDVNINKPFAFYDEKGELVGFDIDLFRAVAKKQNIPFEFNVIRAGQLNTLTNFTNDVMLGGISITSEREKFVDYSFPYMNTGLKLLVKKDSEYTLWNSLIEGRYLKVLIRTIFQPAVLEVGIWYILFILVFAHIVWASDLGRNDGFADNYVKGIGESIYFCFVTCSTVGYGDYTPKTPMSRFMTIILIMCGIAFYANFTATLSAQYTSDKSEATIRDLTDMKNRKIATIQHSTAEKYLRENGHKPLSYSTLEDCLRELRNKKVEGIFYDAPSLDFEARNDSYLEVLPKLYSPQSYGFVLKDDMIYRKVISRGILNQFESGEYETHLSKWFNK
jgi:polar amino acid transport system substrate-binding protein